MTEVFPFENDSRVTYINNITGERWPEWKKYEFISRDEKKQINLASIPETCVLFDKDLPTEKEEEINDVYETFKKALIKRGINYFISWRSPHGFHVLARFSGLSSLDEEVRKEIRKFYVDIFGCDPAKVSTKGVISLPNKPHFKNNVVYGIIDNIEGENILNPQSIQIATKKVEQSQKIQNANNVDIEFKDYFEKDPFFQYIKNNIIPENTNRDMTIFPNLAIAAIKSGKSLKEIKDIIEPIILNNFPGKIYAEFEGWLKKSKMGQIQTYNPYQLNTWAKDNVNKEFYDLKPLKVLEDTVENISNKDMEQKIDNEAEEMNVYWDDEIDKLENINTRWVVESWIPEGDICFIAGKSSSFKTVTSLHLAYAICNGLDVFNKYTTKKSKVLYLNEENPRNVLINFIRKIKKGLQLNNTNKEVGFSIMENIRIDKVDDVSKLISFIQKHNIDVLFLDSFRRFIGFDENNATEMNKVFNNLKAIRKMSKRNLTIVILHHLKKENGQYSSDMRDLLRGSSDIVNSADSIIGIKRKHGSKAIRIEHVKNRSGEEMQEKIITVNTDNDQFYLYETKDLAKQDIDIKNQQEKCADDILEIVKNKKLKIWTKKDVVDDLTKKGYSDGTIKGAFLELKASGEITNVGGSKRNASWTITL